MSNRYDDEYDDYDDEEGSGGGRTLFIVIGLFILFLIIFNIPQCTSPGRTQTNVNVVVAQDAADGLDLQALFEVVDDVSSAEELERRLNEPDGVNNLDLNNDNVVDFIKVTEYGNVDDGAYGFSLTTEPDANSGEQEIASIEIYTNNGEAEVEVRGNNQIYGNDVYYHGFYPVNNFLLWSYLTTPRVFYASPWSYAAYPVYYGVGYAPVSRGAYVNRATSMTQASASTRTFSSRTTGRSNISNPNRGRAASTGITQRLRQPTTTQRSFQNRTTSSVRSTSSTRSTSTRRSTSVRSGSRSRSFGGFGK